MMYKNLKNEIQRILKKLFAMETRAVSERLEINEKNASADDCRLE